MNNKETGHSIVQKYQVLDEVSHVLKRPGMYIGSTKPHIGNIWILKDGSFEKEEISYNPGFLKLFDEIITNSVDEHKRSGKIDKIKVTIQSNRISIWDNGGIPVIEHPTYGKWIPELIFSKLRSGSNFNDEESRTFAGTNGVGSVLVNIFSKEFSINTCDGKNKFTQVFTQNMSNRTVPVITRSKVGFTEISYEPDLERFGMQEIGDSHMKMMRKRVIDLAATNPNLTLEFNGESFNFKTFKEYADLYVKDQIWEKSQDWEISVGLSKDGYQSVSFINAIGTKDGGTHEQYILNQLIEYLRTFIKKKHKVDVKPSEIKNHMFLFINCTVINPAFSSQTKEKLITEPKEFGTSHEVSEKFAKAVFSSEIIASLLDWIEQKKLAEERAELRKLNKSLNANRIPKLIDAQNKDRKNCILGIFEGQSAISAVRKFRDNQNFGAFPLKGKFINVSELSNSEVIKNEEAVQLIASIGLKLGEEPTDLRYSKIYIYVDADNDGIHISCCLLNFFNKFWPELINQGMVFKVMTPLVVAKKGKETISFYENSDFVKWTNEVNIKGWEIEYKKGLASLENKEYEDIIKNPVLIKLVNDPDYKSSLDCWFGSDNSGRKIKLLDLSK